MPISSSRHRSSQNHVLPYWIKICCLWACCQIYQHSVCVDAALIRATATDQNTAPWRGATLTNSYDSGGPHGPWAERQGRESHGRRLERQERLVTLRTDMGQHSQGASGGRRKRKHYVLSVAKLSIGHGPNRQCAADCTKHGVCNEELGRCDCPRGWSGLDCSQAPEPDEMKRVCAETHYFHYEGNCTDEGGVPEPYPYCVNACNNRGKCRAGWCHCKPGYWGADCSLSMDANGKPAVLAGMGYTLRQKKPSVYIYDLPHRLTSWRNPSYSDRPLHIAMWHRLLGAGCVTTDGDQADYFYFPVSVRGPSEGLLLEAAINYARTYWPYWDRYQGARHLVIHTGDTGRAELTNRTLILVSNTTFLTHWGLTKNYPYSGWRASHIENRDVVIPIHMAAMGARSSGLQVSPLHPKSGADKQPIEKDSELIFAGRICGGRDMPDGTKGAKNCEPASKGYSQGVRQLVHQHHWNRTGFHIAVSMPNYFERLTKTRFCLAPSGGGHGHRQILVAFSGCTPLIISDYVLQPFEPALNWTRFAVTLPQSSIPDLHKILPTISADRYKQMQAALPCAAQHFAWSTSTGSFMHESGKYDAFETTMEILRMMRKYPGVPHMEFESMDPEYQAFMECRSDDYMALSDVARQNQQTAEQQNHSNSVPTGSEAAGNSSTGTNPLCSLSKWDGVPCEKCLVTYRRTVPGGALCCQHVDNLAACPRLWP